MSKERRERRERRRPRRRDTAPDGDKTRGEKTREETERAELENIDEERAKRFVGEDDFNSMTIYDENGNILA